MTHTYSQPGTFIVSLSLSTQEGCTATVQIPLSISPAPLADFDFTNTCQALPTQFTDLTSLNGGTILISHAWDFGDPSSGSANTSTAASPTHTFTAPGTYTVTLITQNASGCADTLDKPVTVVPKPGVERNNFFNLQNPHIPILWPVLSMSLFPLPIPPDARTSSPIR
ncbi:MAG: PKD domain-containing protein [Bacteroidales bacterium]|nr:PKD domain-containing protein [Bacteroidales bacterium]